MTAPENTQTIETEGDNTVTDHATPDAPQESPDAPQDTLETPDAPQDTETKPGREAAKYRRQLRETEAERDTLTDQLRAARSAAIEHAARSKVTISEATANMGPLRVQLLEPGDLVKFGGVEVNDMFDDDGALNTERFADAMRALYEARPRLFGDRLPRADYTQGRGDAAPQPPAWASAFAPK